MFEANLQIRFSDSPGETFRKKGTKKGTVLFIKRIESSIKKLAVSNARIVQSGEGAEGGVKIKVQRQKLKERP